MTIKHMLTYVEGLPSDTVTLETSYRLSKLFNTSIEVLHIQLDARDTIPFIGQGISAPVVEQIVSSIDSEGTSITKRAHEIVNEFLKSHPDIALASDTNMHESAHMTWTKIKGRAAEVLPEYARLADVTVLSQMSLSQDMSKLVAEETILESGRLTLFAAEDIPENIGQKIVFYWNGSRESARMLAAGLPFLLKAQEITIVTADESDHLGPGSKALLKALSHYNLNPRLLKLNEEGERLAESLLDKTLELKADLLMMGAYSHSKLRQWVMGSMTDHVLENTSVPLLLIH